MERGAPQTCVCPLLVEEYPVWAARSSRVRWGDVVVDEAPQSVFRAWFAVERSRHRSERAGVDRPLLTRTVSSAAQPPTPGSILPCLPATQGSDPSSATRGRAQPLRTPESAALVSTSNSSSMLAVHTCFESTLVLTKGTQIGWPRPMPLRRSTRYSAANIASFHGTTFSGSQPW
jgi:hypothetical protein